VLHFGAQTADTLVDAARLALPDAGLVRPTMTAPTVPAPIHQAEPSRARAAAGEREDLTFRSGEDRCAAFFYRPDGAAPTNGFPCVVMAIDLDGRHHPGIDRFARRFATAGFAVLAFDYRPHGGSEGEPRRLLRIDRQQADWRAALGWVRAQPGLDAGRMALWGSSLSGGHVLAVAQTERDVAAVIAQVPFTDGLAQHLRRVRRTRLGHRACLTRSGIRDRVAELRSSMDWSLVRNELALARYRPGHGTDRIECPVLYCLADDDTVLPAAAARRAAWRTPDSTVLLYHADHLGLCDGPPFDRAVRDQIDFLQGVLHL
jgi:dienelactone hydrolase